MKAALLRAWAPGIPAIYKLIDLSSRYKGDPGHYGHAALVFDDGTALSAHTDSGVLIEPLEYPEADWDFYAVAGDESAVRQWAAGELGAPYDYEGVMRFVDPLAHQSPDRWFCSEIVVAALQQIGMFAGVEPWRVSPNKLGKMLHDASIDPHP